MRCDAMRCDAPGHLAAEALPTLDGLPPAPPPPLSRCTRHTLRSARARHSGELRCGPQRERDSLLPFWYAFDASAAWRMYQGLGFGPGALESDHQSITSRPIGQNQNIQMRDQAAPKTSNMKHSCPLDWGPPRATRHAALPPAALPRPPPRQCALHHHAPAHRKTTTSGACPSPHRARRCESSFGSR